MTGFLEDYRIRYPCGSKSTELIIKLCIITIRVAVTETLTYVQHSSVQPTLLLT